MMKGELTMRATYREGHVKPAIGVGVELEDLLVAVFSLKTAVDDNILARQDRSGVMRNAARAFAGGLDLLPFEVDLIAVLLHHLVDAGEVQAPH